MKRNRNSFSNAKRFWAISFVAFLIFFSFLFFLSPASPSRPGLDGPFVLLFSSFFFFFLKSKQEKTSSLGKELQAAAHDGSDFYRVFFFENIYCTSRAGDEAAPFLGRFAVFLFSFCCSCFGIGGFVFNEFCFFLFFVSSHRSPQPKWRHWHPSSKPAVGRPVVIHFAHFFCDPQTHTPSIIISSMKTAGRSAIRHRRSALMKRPPAAVPSKPPDPSHGPKRVTATTRITPKKKTKKNRRKTIKVKVECNQIPIVPAKRKKKEKKNESNQIKVAVPSRGQRFRAISYRGIKKKTNPVGG